MRDHEVATAVLAVIDNRVHPAADRSFLSPPAWVATTTEAMMPHPSLFGI
jgi:hypothetical protein